MLECVINISEGIDTDRLRRLQAACHDHLLDVHTDPHHHRSVFTLAGPSVEDAARDLAAAAINIIDIREHIGVHPRIGVVDVVPFVPLAGSSMDDAIAARNAFASWLASKQVPSFVYGSERTLPELRKGAFSTLSPDYGPPKPHLTAGAAAVGARPVLVAYNLWIDEPDVRVAREVARAIRLPELRTLGLQVGTRTQVSCNLIAPATLGPDVAYDLVAERATITRAELVGLLPRAVLIQIPHARWSKLDLSEEKTIEARLTPGLNSGEVK